MPVRFDSTPDMSLTVAQVGVMFDEEMTERSEWVGRGADGFPVQEGKLVEVVGKHLIIRRAC